MTRQTRCALALLVYAFVGAGCALTSKADRVNVRYFSPPVGASTGPSADGEGAPAVDPRTLRMGHVRAADHLRSTIVYQKSDVELGTYDDDFWTERPTDYVERAIRAELYQRRGLTESLSNVDLTLDVQVLAFQEVRRGEKRSARVTLSFTLHDRGSVTDASEVSVDVPTKADGLEGVVTAMGAALRQAVQELGDRVDAKVPAAPAISPSASPSTSSPTPPPARP